MYCKACGNKIEASSAFCPVCGTKTDPLRGEADFSYDSSRPDAPYEKALMQGHTNSLAIAGFVLSVVSLFFALMGLVPIIALVLCIIALVQIKNRGEGGKGFAIAGLVISAFSLLSVLFVMVVILPELLAY